MYKMRIFHSQIGWVHTGLYKTIDEAELSASNLKRFGSSFYHEVEIIETTRIKYLFDILKIKIDNLFW